MARNLALRSEFELEHCFCLGLAINLELIQF